MSATAPHDVHAAGAERFAAEVERSAQTSRRVSLARLVVFVAGALSVFLIYDLQATYAFALIPLALFVALVVVHEVIERRARDARARLSFHTAANTRIAGTWRGTGTNGARFADEAHPCARDIDMFGEGSLFELLCRATTPFGEDTLAGWLRTPSFDSEALSARQDAVRALAPAVQHREDLAAAGHITARAARGTGGLMESFGQSLGTKKPVDAGSPLALWATQSVELPGALRYLAMLLAALTVAALAAWGLDRAPFALVGGLLIAELILAVALQKRVNAVLTGATSAADGLSVLARVLGQIEQLPADPRLDLLKASLTTGERTATREIAHLAKLVARANQRRNQFFLPFALVLMWGTIAAFSLEAWRRRTGGRVPAWLAAVGEIEALASLAAFSFEHPKAAFPEFSEDHVFEADQLGHPLLPPHDGHPAGGVRNDVKLGGEDRVLIVSGSNMSGKSTLLRSVGIAAVLGAAGGPVFATRCTMGPLVVGASILVRDSIADGRSRFYAELLRLKQVVDLADGERPLLFLLDEVLSGTNSHDRQIGAQALLVGLVERGAIGLVTTHDLALTEVEALGDRAHNVHLADKMEGDVLQFDYHLREGVVTHSNALALMAAVGLDVQ